MVRGIFFSQFLLQFLRKFSQFFPMILILHLRWGECPLAGAWVSAWACIRQSFCEDFAGLARVLKAWRWQLCGSGVGPTVPLHTDATVKMKFSSG